MHVPRFVRIIVPLVILCIIGLVPGCSGSQSGRGFTPPDKETSKKIAEEMKSMQRDKMKAMREMRKGR
jgi:hypothetical protein